MTKFLDFSYILATILFTVYGQLIIKWRVNYLGDFPVNQTDKLKHAFFLIFDPFILSGFCAAFLASLAWISAMSKFELSYAYPFTGLTFALIIILSAVIFNESLTFFKVLGIGFIMVGIWFASRQ